MVKKILPIGLSLIVLSSSCLSVYASDIPTQKEEVVYLMTDAQGKTDTAYVVNSFTDKKILDYGDYTDVKALNTTDMIEQNNDRIQISTDAEKLYYQGTLKNIENPWDISVQYFLDGKEYTPKDLAGKSGDLEIKLSIDKNKKARGNFYENYALQVSLSLDTKQCDNITAEGATLANVGNQKQISYIALPSEGLHTSIKTKVTDFEMSGISINGVQLNLNIDIEDKELKEKVNELINATSQLNNGAEELKTGNGALKDGSASLPSGAKQLDSGISSLDNGILSLQNGMIQIQDGLTSLNEKSGNLVQGSSDMKNALEQLQSALSSVSGSTDELEALTASSSQIKQGITDLYTGMTQLQSNVGYEQYKSTMGQNGVDIDSLLSNNTAAVEEINGQIQTLQALLPQIKDTQLQEQLTEQIGSLQNVLLLLNGNSGAINGMENYLNTVSSNINTLEAGMEKLNNQYTSFDSAIGQLTGNVKDILVNMTSLSSAVNEIVTKYQSLDNGIGEYTEGVASLAAGYQELVGGVSELATGSKELIFGSGNLYNGAEEVYQNIEKLYEGAEKLADGTGELNAQTSTMEADMESQIDEILSGISGGDIQPVSFVSSKNTKITSVQFVIQTKAIEKQDETIETIESDKSSQSFWDKFLALFGIE